MIFATSCSVVGESLRYSDCSQGLKRSCTIYSGCNAAWKYISIFPPDYQINKLASNWWMFHEGWMSQTCLSARFDFSVESSGENGGITVWAKDDSSENHFFPASLISQTVCSLFMQTFQNLFCGEREMQFATYHHIAAIRLELMLVTWQERWCSFSELMQCSVKCRILAAGWHLALLAGVGNRRHRQVSRV